jgi:L-asparaginase II
VGGAVVEVTRGGAVESRHRVHVAVWHAERGLVASAGDPAFRSFVRSAVKPFQALPLVEDDGVAQFDLSPEEVALTTASHGSESIHVVTARSILAKAGLPDEALACGPQWPMHGPSADARRAAGGTPLRVHNNCSGKHAGMLALAVRHRWPTAGYEQFEHPVQQRMRATLAGWMHLPPGDLAVAVDGCGIPTYAAPLDAVARACARLSSAAADQDAAPRTVLAAMMAHSELVAGTARLCTDLMRSSGGRLWAKVGAEGYYCAGVPAERLGIAIKIEDGAWRAAEPRCWRYSGSLVCCR